MKKLILLHGWGGNKEYWDSLKEQFIDYAEIEAVDFPGFGKEKLVSDEWGVPDYASWLEKRIKQSKDKEIILLGHSFGGRVAAEIAARNPKWLKGLILDASPCLHRPSSKTLLKIKAYKTLKKFMPDRVKDLLYPKDLTDANKRGLGKIFRKVVRHDQTMQLTKVKVPTLIIWGENDKEVPLRIGKEMHKLIPNSTIEVFSNTGHFPLVDNPYLYYGVVKKFIQNI